MQKKVQHFCATCTGVQKSVQRFLRNMHGCACIVENIAQSRGANTLLSLATFLNLSYNCNCFMVLVAYTEEGAMSLSVGKKKVILFL